MFGFTLYVTVEPAVGINTFVIGTVISMLFSHYFLFLDANYVKPKIKAHKEKESLKQKQIERAKEKVKEKEEANNNDNIYDSNELIPPPTMPPSAQQVNNPNIQANEMLSPQKYV